MRRSPSGWGCMLAAAVLLVGLPARADDPAIAPSDGCFVNGRLVPAGPITLSGNSRLDCRGDDPAPGVTILAKGGHNDISIRFAGNRGLIQLEGPGNRVLIAGYPTGNAGTIIGRSTDDVISVTGFGDLARHVRGVGNNGLIQSNSPRVSAVGIDGYDRGGTIPRPPQPIPGIDNTGVILCPPAPR
ncbi:hypothetical protein ACW9HQ_39105 [Nocardia gipuzkoensis]